MAFDLNRLDENGVHSYAEILKCLTALYDPQIEQKILGFFMTGSRVYGTFNEESDWDYICVVKEPTKNILTPLPPDPRQVQSKLEFAFDIHEIDVFEYPPANLNITFYDLEYFTILLHEHHVAILEIPFTPKLFVLKPYAFDNQIDSAVLKITNGWAANLKFSTAKRRLAEGKLYKAKKLVFLSLRYLHFTIQLLDKNRIDDFSGANKYWEQIKNSPATTWDEFEAEFWPLYVELEKKLRSFQAYTKFYTNEDVDIAAITSLKQHPVEDKNGSKSLAAPIVNQAELEVVKYLREKGLDSLRREYSVMTCRHSKYPNLVQLSYAPGVEPINDITRECNGLLVDCANNFQVIGFPFKKFYDDIEVDRADKMDWSTAKFQPKYDGSCAVLYFYDGKWHVASRRIPDGLEAVCWLTSDGAVKPKQEFAQVFWNIWQSNKMTLPDDADTDKCFIFEMLSPHFRRVALHDPEQIVFLGVRDLKTLREVDTTPFLEKYLWPAAHVFSEIHSVAEAKKFVAQFDPFKQIGLVAVDAHHNRLKFKNIEYLAAQTSQGFMNKLNPFNLGGDHFERDCLLEVVRLCKARKFLLYFAKWKRIVEELTLQHDAFCEFLDKSYTPYKDIETQQEFAKKMAMVDPALKVVFFDWRKEAGKPNAKLYCARLEKKTYRKNLQFYLATLQNK
jgi:predicted nucleotidyltransferase